MFHADDKKVRALLLNGNFGLEKESLRVDGKGRLSHTRNPFPGNEHIVRDFCENQTEINTGVSPTAEGAVEELDRYYREIQRTLKNLPEREYLWCFSNPPYIRDEEDIPIAVFDGDKASKTEYRKYLSDRYGRYKMSFSGIHFNYSFSDELLKADFALSEKSDYREYVDDVYVALAEKVVNYGWLIVAATAASPIVDASFSEKGKGGESLFEGLASMRCSEFGYWNFFAPILDYTSVRTYADSIQRYVDLGLIKAPTELYYPVRLKPRGKNRLQTLKEEGVNHIELRMFDLNPLVPVGIELKDVKFAQLFLAWLASTPRSPFSVKDQVQAIQNFKNAAHYDLKTVKIVDPSGEVCTVVRAAKEVIAHMREFYRDFPREVTEILDFEEAKFDDGENRYAWKLKKMYEKNYVEKGLELAKRRQDEANEKDV